MFLQKRIGVMNSTIKKLFKLLLLIPCAVQAASLFDNSSKFVPGFGSGGYVSRVQTLNDIAIDSSGKIVVAGKNGIIARYNSDGTLDTTFGTGGSITSADFGSFFAVKIDANGKIVVGGSSTGANVLARYDSNGDLDNNFGTNGIATATASSLQKVYDFAFDSSGAIIAVGENNLEQAAIARFTADGIIDTNFGNAGFGDQGYFDNNHTDAIKYTSIAIDSNGNIIVAGICVNANIPQGIIAKYTNSGSFVFDTSFGGINGGVVPLTGSFYINTLKLDSSGKIVVAGDASLAGYSIIARFNSNGSVDTSFHHSSGKVTSDITAGSYTKLVIDTNGKIVLVGKKSGGLGSEGVIARYNSDGWLDTTFNGTGYINVENGTDSEQFNSISLDQNSRIVAVGFDDANPNKGLIVRYLANGTLDVAGNWTSSSLIAHFTAQGKKLGLLSSGR